MTYPTPQTRAAMTAFLGGWIEELNLQVMTLDEARAVLARVTPAGTTIDGMAVSRIMRRLKFNRSYRPADAGTITYRRIVE